MNCSEMIVEAQLKYNCGLRGMNYRELIEPLFNQLEPAWTTVTVREWSLQDNFSSVWGASTPLTRLEPLFDWGNQAYSMVSP